MSYIKEVVSLGRTYDFKLTLQCNHVLERATSLYENQRNADQLFRLLGLMICDRVKEESDKEIIADFKIFCPECKMITKFSQINGIEMTCSNNLVEY
jgi:hypothetical protein